MSHRSLQRVLAYLFIIGALVMDIGSGARNEAVLAVAGLWFLILSNERQEPSR